MYKLRGLLLFILKNLGLDSSLLLTYETPNWQFFTLFCGLKHVFTFAEPGYRYLSGSSHWLPGEHSHCKGIRWVHLYIGASIDFHYHELPTAMIWVPNCRVYAMLLYKDYLLDLYSVNCSTLTLGYIPNILILIGVLIVYECKNGVIGNSTYVCVAWNTITVMVIQ